MGRVRDARGRVFGRLLVTGLLLLGLAGCAVPIGPLQRRAGEEERNAFRQAVALRPADPSAAVQELQAFLTRWPTSSLADDAGLVLGEMLLEQGARDAAIDALLRVTELRPGNKTDAARILLAKLQRERGEFEAAYRTARSVRRSAITLEQQREVVRLQADLAGEIGDLAARLRWLAELHATAPDEDARALIDTEIDELMGTLDVSDLSRAADAMQGRGPEARVRLRLAELAAARGDLGAARRQLEHVRDLPLGPFDEKRLERLEVLTGLRQRQPPAPLPPSLAELGRVEPLEVSRAHGTLGVVLPLSGAFAQFGEQSLQGILLATGVMDVTAPLSANGIRVRVRDSGSTAAGAERAVRELAQDPSVSAIVGPLALRESSGAARAAREERIPLLSLSRREPAAGRNPYEFRLGLSPEDEARRLAGYAVQNLSAHRFAILYPRDRYGRTLRTLFWEAVEERGGELVGVAGYDPEATDFSGAIRRLVGFALLTSEEKELIEERDRLLRRAKRHPPELARELREEAAAITGPEGEPLPPRVDFDVLFVPDSQENIILIAPQLAFHGAEAATLLGTSVWDHPDLVRVGGKHVEGAVFTVGYHRGDPHPFATDFRRRYEASFGHTPESFAARSFDAASLVLARWIDGADTREELRAELSGLERQPGVGGVFSIGSDGNAVRRPHLVTIERGQLIPAE